MVKIYIDDFLDCSGYDERVKPEISVELTSEAEGFKVIKGAVPYDEVIELKGLIKKKIRKRRN